MLGRTVSHYRIVSQLGTGGMGVVYGGVDTRLGRTVAIKFVPEEFAKDRQVVDRLRVEARAASSLNHPNICTIYDVGEDDGRPFIVMELIKGQSLWDALASGPLKIRQVVDIGTQVADALDAAHSHGILHRDIKPANLFLTDRGQVKILDFGLAKLLDRHAASGTTTGKSPRHLTDKGVTIGTVAYMSPEQVTGEELDGRTDLFSLGVVLYECVTGHRPFTGKTSAVIFSAILNRAPVAPVVLNPETPLRLQEIINNCLEKDRELRYQDAAGLRADLKRLRRDLDPPHTEAAGSFAVTAPYPREGSAGGRVAPQPTPAPRPPSSQLPPGSGPHPIRSWLGILLTAAVTVALAAAVSYLISSRPQVSAPPADAPANASETQPGTDFQSRLEMATASLQAGDFRAALAYAEDVLRIAPQQAEAIRVRDQAGAALKRAEDELARAQRLFAAGDLNGAAAALEAARKIDPAASGVGEMSARLVDRFKNEALTAREQARAKVPPLPVRPPARAEPPPSSSPNQPAAETAKPSSAPPPSVSPAIPALPPPGPVQTSPVPAPPAASPPPPAPAQPAQPPPAAAATKGPEPAPTPAPAEAPGRGRGNAAANPSQAEDDDAAIRRVIATYARAIENKDIALFRSVKPNLSAEEQRRIQDGFRAVTSQRVAITILSISRAGPEASVRLARRDTITAGGRQQTMESQQTLILIRNGTDWVIREIG